MADNEQKKILIVDDDSVVLRTMKDGLSDRYKVFGANSGANALKVLSRMEVDLILLDYEMPGMNGEEVLKALKADEALKSIPVMFLTGLKEGSLDLESLPVEKALGKSAPMSEISGEIDAFFDT